MGAPTIINRHPDAGWEERPTFYIETRSPITEKLQRANPNANKKRFRYGVGALRERWNQAARRNEWVWPLSEPEEITPDDDETFIVVGGSEISREECKEMVSYMRQKATARRAVRQEQRPSAQQVNDALLQLAEMRLRAAKGVRTFARLDRISAREVATMSSVARSGEGLR